MKYLLPLLLLASCARQPIHRVTRVIEKTIACPEGYYYGAGRMCYPVPVKPAIEAPVAPQPIAHDYASEVMMEDIDRELEEESRTEDEVIDEVEDLGVDVSLDRTHLGVGSTTCVGVYNKDTISVTGGCR